jgi:hypothetical protein
MTLRVHKRPSPIKYEFRYIAAHNGERAKGDLLDEVLNAVDAGEWFQVVDAAFVTAQALKPRSNLLTITIEIK